MELDQIDLKILAELQKNGRITNAELARVVNLSPSPCLLRMKRLEDEKYIVNYYARIDPQRLGKRISVFTKVLLGNRCQTGIARFLNAASGYANIVECHLISGDYDCLLKFSASSVSDYQSTMDELIDHNFGIDRFQSFVVLKSALMRDSVQLNRLFAL